MNVYFNKDFLKFKKINNRYLKFNDHPDKQIGISDNFNIFNKSNLIKANNIYNSNYFLVNNKLGNINDITKNKNIIKKDNSLRLNPLLLKNKKEKENNNLQLYISNFKNNKSNPKIAMKGREINEEKEENKYNNDSHNIFKTNDSVPTIVKIQKLIESLQSKHSASTENNDNNIKIKNEEKYDINNIKKKNEKLPSLISDIKANFKPQKNDVNEQFLFPMKDINKSKVNHTKIKLKNINHDSHLLNKHTNKTREENITSHNIKIQAKDLPLPKKEIPRKPKVSINQIKNIIKKGLIINNNGSYEKIVNIRLKSDNAKKYFNASAYQSNSLSQMKSQKESADFCLSNYNNYKNNLMILKQTFHNFENERTKKEKFFNKNQTMFGNPLNEKKLKEEEEDESNEENQKRFSKYFLPSSGFGLLERHDIDN